MDYDKSGWTTSEIRNKKFKKQHYKFFDFDCDPQIHVREANMSVHSELLRQRMKERYANYYTC